MVVTRYMNGKEITQADLKAIKITDNPDILRLLDRVVARVNREASQQKISTDDLPA